MADRRKSDEGHHSATTQGKDGDGWPVICPREEMIHRVALTDRCLIVKVAINGSEWNANETVRGLEDEVGLDEHDQIEDYG